MFSPVNEVFCLYIFLNNNFKQIKVDLSLLKTEFYKENKPQCSIKGDNLATATPFCRIRGG